MLFASGDYLERIIHNEGGVHDRRLANFLVQLGDELARAVQADLGMTTVLLQNGQSSSRVRSKETPSPACSLASSVMGGRRQSPDKSMVVALILDLFSVP